MGILLLALSNVASATVIVDQIGDDDGFGIGATHGSSFSWGSIGSGDGDGTDVWIHGDANFTHTYDISSLGTITSATLELFTGGQGWHGLSAIYIDGTYVGDLTDGDGVGPGYNYAWLDTFDLMAYASLLDGANTLTIDVSSSGDGWALDYSRLTISDEGMSVPEPGLALLLGFGLISLSVSRKRK